MKEIENINIDKTYERISNLIETSKERIQIQVNSEMTFLYWNIGKDITENVLKVKNLNMENL